MLQIKQKYNKNSSDKNLTNLKWVVKKQHTKIF